MKLSSLNQQTFANASSSNSGTNVNANTARANSFDALFFVKS